ncbi:trans-sulfuration enzyme family protein [Polyangium jinanense]|uniref:PLP-dependent transferase n=1 Tax=Polyangium jinanense TaxID=2829994 RepID=A0A9X3X0B2_9BACT|nr:PLP-dependent transferase [Polyangium jinanense]MDC3954825.1 PLP-dependent transferase [Polyangium jinanense]MDC3981404.1 PLP-dependent transferase [Polyangium jinanense]
MKSSPHRPATLALHAGLPEGAPRAVGAPISPPITTTTSFHTAPDAVGFSAADLQEAAPHFYTRWGNPTIELLEGRLAALEEGAAAVCFASGMGAVSALFFARLGAGAHLVLSDVCYAGVAELAHETLPRFGIEVTTTNTADPECVAAAIRPGATRLVHIETPANPILKLSDIAAIAEVAHAAGAELSVDSTIATPIATRPLALGADYVVHSLTKYICGHGDTIAGAVVGRSAERMAALRKEALIHYGAALHPFAAWLVLRGLETLPARMRIHEENARRVATWLTAHPRVAAVHWPGLPSHPQRALAERQMQNASGLLAFTVKDGSPALAKQFAERLRVISYAVSLGKTKSLLFYIPTDDILRTSFRLAGAQEAAYRAAAGEGVFRLSVGLEDPDDLIADLDQALGG